MALMVAVCWMSMTNGLPIQEGAQMFLIQHRILLVTIWVLVPLLTVDCLSRERREGTIGLLFLTPLKAWQIVLAKCFVHGWRACGLWLAVLPVMTIPLLMGGVDFEIILTACAFHFASIFLATSTGLLASALCKSWQASLVVMVILAGACLIYGLKLTGWSVHYFENGLVAPVQRLDYYPDGYPAFQHGLEFTTDLGISRNSGRRWLVSYWPAALSVCGLSLLFLLTVVLLCAWIVLRSWQEKPPSRLQLWWRETFCTPVVLVHFFRGWMRQKMERNPVGWLEQRTWVGRTITWSWLAVMVSVMSFLLVAGGMGRDFIGLFEGLAWLLMGCLAFSAAGSFRRERENGALELLLVTPLGSRAILDGRIRGLRAQFLISIGLWAAVYLYLAPSFLFMESVHWLGALIRFGVMFGTLPVIGLYFSLCRQHFLTAFLWTFLVGLVLPDALVRLLPVSLSILSRWTGGLFPWGFPDDEFYGHEIVYAAVAPSALLLIAWFLKRRLQQRLEQRKFSFQQ